MMSSAGIPLSEFKRTNSTNRTLSRVLMPRRPDSGGSMRLAERCTERARATTSHKPRRHSNQSTLPIRRRSPRVPYVHHTLAGVDICASHYPASSGATTARAQPWFHVMAPGLLWITAATLATRSGLATPILPSDGGFRPPDTSQP
jgi:hypothetical protein